jgi:hypothetical protein
VKLGTAACVHTAIRRRSGRLMTTSLPLPRILSSRVGDRLPLEVPNRIGPATGERPYVIFPVARTSTACFASRRARVLPLEFARHFTGSIFLGRKRGGTSERDRQRDNEACPRHRPLMPNDPTE